MCVIVCRCVGRSPRMANVVRAPAPSSLCDAIERRLHDVKEVQVPRLVACTSASDLAELEAELQATLHKIASFVQQLDDDVEEGETPEERQALRDMAHKQRKALQALRQDTRRALLTAHRAVQAHQHMAARTALLGTAPKATVTSLDGPKDRAGATSEQVTSALQRTVALMSGELEKSGYSAQLLEESSDVLSQVSQKYESFNDLLRDSISLIRQMERAELVDFGILAGSILFFVGCVAYILYVRVLSRGIWALGTAWRATNYVGAGAWGGASSLAAAASSAAAAMHTSVASHMPSQATPGSAYSAPSSSLSSSTTAWDDMYLPRDTHGSSAGADAMQDMPPSTWTSQDIMQDESVRGNIEALHDDLLPSEGISDPALETPDEVYVDAVSDFDDAWPSVTESSTTEAEPASAPEAERDIERDVEPDVEPKVEPDARFDMSLEAEPESTPDMTVEATPAMTDESTPATTDVEETSSHPIAEAMPSTTETSDVVHDDRPSAIGSTALPSVTGPTEDLLARLTDALSSHTISPLSATTTYSPRSQARPWSDEL